MSGKHTPGPWAWYRNDDGGVWLGTVSGGLLNVIQPGPAGTWSGTVRFCKWDGGRYMNRGEMLEAGEFFRLGMLDHPDARLMAAAPESHASNVELAAIVREMCRALRVPEPADALARSDAAIAKATGEHPKEQA